MNTIVQTTACNCKTHGKPGILARLMFWNQIWVERQALKDMDPHLLQDVGLSREAANREARRSSWDAPERWLR